ncbi:MAG: NYN domain-containing protein [Clostridia bacterium]
MNNKIALLIDAENISGRYVGTIFDELSKYGVVTYKRIYGDWTSPNMSTWKQIIREFALSPIQQFQNTTNKNSSDSALIIDAMDILYSEDVECFCVVSSDGDYTRLITRIREDGIYVIGMGEKKAPTSIVKVCDKFVYLDIRNEEEREEKEEKEEKDESIKGKDVKKAPPQKKPQQKKRTRNLEPDKIKGAIKIINELSDEEGYANFSEVYNRMIKIYSDMDAGNYGYSKSSDLFSACPSFIMKKEPGKASKLVMHIYIKVKQE